MNLLNEIFVQCAAQGVGLTLVDGALEVSFEQMPDEQLLSLLKANKPQLIEYLERNQDKPEQYSTIAALGSQSAGLSHTQKRIWFAQQYDPDGVQYNICHPLEFSGPLSIERFTESIAYIVRRHEMLRTTFERNEPISHVQPAAEVNLTQVDLSDLAQELTDAKVQELALAQANMPFDLSGDTMLRVLLIKRAKERFCAVFTFHHIACDGWSLGVFVNEFAAVYRALCTSQPVALQPLPIQYGDFVHWQQDMADVLEQDIAYWMTRLADIPQVHQLPLDRPRPAQQSFEAGLLTQQIDEDLGLEIEAFCQRFDVTPFMAMYTIFALLLKHYSGQTDVVVGTPIAGRTHAQLNDLIGCFANTLALRSDLSQLSDFATLLAETKQMLLDAYSHQDAPFDILVERLQPERNLSYLPVVQILFAFHNQQQGQFDIPGISVTPNHGLVTTVKADIDVAVHQQGKGYAIDWRFASAIFDTATIARMSESYLLLLRAMLEMPERAIASVNFVPAQELAQLKQSALPSKIEAASAECLHQLFEQQVAKFGHHSAVTFDDQTLSYQALNNSANRLALLLVEQYGVKPNGLVGLYLERSIDTVVAILAVLKAGGAYVPLDPDHPPSRTQYIVEDAGLSIVLTSSSLVEQLTQNAPAIAQTVCVDDTSAYAEMSGENIAPEQLGLQGQHMAYVIYTSGSTGQPKGVMVSHHNVVRLLSSAQRRFDFDHTDVWTMFHSYAFDFSVWELWGALAFGGRLVVVPYWVSRSVSEFYQLVAAQKVTVLNQTPSAFNAFIQQDVGARQNAMYASRNSASPLSLRYVIFGGEALNFKALKPWVAHHGDDKPRLINMYGITETTVHVSFRRVSAAAIEQASGASLIGVPLDDLAVVILNNERQPLPFGVIGEMYVAGPGVTNGYLNRAQLSAERFIELDVFAEGKPQRYYRTGDLARQSLDGELEYCGRIDHQVKIRGFRIELGEIQAALSAIAGVSDAYVTTYQAANSEGEQNGQQIVAYIVTPQTLQDSQVRSQLAARLPSYMIPAAIVNLPQLPLTSNGKIDTKLLPPPDHSAAQSQYVAPSNEVERKLCHIVQELLAIEQVGMNDNFFSIGGHSLMAVQLVAEIAQQLAVELSVKDIFEHSEISAIAAVIADHRLQPPTRLADKLALVPQPREDGQPQPLSFAQQRLWVVDKLTGGGIEYNMFNIVPVATGVDVDKLEQAIAQIIERHEPLRTVFVETPEGPLQVVKNDVQFNMERHNLDHLSFSQKRQEIDKLIDQQQTQPFDLSSDLMIRVLYVAAMSRCGLQQGGLLVSIHHIAFDGASVEIFLTELEACYVALCQGHEAQLPPLPVSYADYAYWQRKLYEQGDIEAQLVYWRARLADIPQLHALPLDNTRPKVQDNDGIVHKHSLSEAQVEGLQQLAQAHGTTLFVVMQTLFALWVGRYSNQTDVVVSSPVAGRGERQLKHLIGFFVNNHVIRTELDGALSFNQLLRECARRYVADQHHLELPYDLLVNDLNPPRSGSYNPVAQLRFSLDNLSAGQSATFKAGAENLFTQHFVTTSRFDLALHGVKKDQDIDLFWVANSSLFGVQTLNTFAESFNVLLANVLAQPGQAIARLDFMAKSDKQLINRVFQAEPLEHPQVAITRIFEQHCVTTPNATALCCNGVELSYASFNAQANRLAHLLKDRFENAESQPLVGVAMTRSIDAMIAIVGILKAGCAYVPIDPSYPANRIAYMVQDAGIELLLVQQKDRASLESMAATLVVLDSDEYRAQAEHYSSENPTSQVSGDSVATVIYTSGSTGTPKGVELTHTGLLAYCYSGMADYGGEHLRGAFVMTSLSFGVTVPCLFIPLLSGTCVELFEQDTSFEQIWQRILDCEQPRLLRMTPAHVRTLVALTGDEQHCLRQHTFVIGGDQFNGNDLSLLRRFFPQAKIYNHYGCTEVIVGCSLFDTSDLEPGADQSIPIGMPLRNVSLYVLDEYQQPVAVGCVGELYVYRRHLAKGYLNDRQRSDRKFYQHCLVNPNAAADEMMFRTGDLVRYDQQGRLNYVGRSDHQVNLRGFRIELAEIELTIKRMAQVTQALVIVDEQAAEQPLLVAYVVAADGQDDSALIAQVREHVAQHLPDYMVPEHIKVLQALPLTPNGKLDRNGLPKLSLEGDSNHYQPPENPLQTQLCELFQDVLQLEKVGIDDNFFLLGGNSLLGVKLTSMLAASLNYRVSLRQLFEANTIRQLELVLRQQSPATSQQSDGTNITARHQSALDESDIEEIEL